MGWRWLLFDAVTREPQAELLAVDGVTFGDTLNSPGSFAAKVALDQAGSTVTMASLSPPRAVFAAEKDDVLLWAGFIWTHDYDVNAGTLAIAGEGYLSWLRRRILRNTKHFYVEGGATQEAIGWDLIDYAQAQTGGNVGIVDKRQSSGQLRDRHYYAYERKNLGELLEQLAAVNGGFDFRFVPRWTDGPNSTLAVDWATTYPKTGRDTDLVFELGANIDIPAVTLDGTSLAYYVSATGKGEGDAIPIVDWQYPDLIAANLLLEAVTIHGDVSETPTLNDYAILRLNRGKQPIVIPKATVPADLLGHFAVGDQVQVRADRGLLQLDGRYRIVESQVNVPAAGPETVTLSFAPLELFDA